MKIYDKNGWVNWKDIVSGNESFISVVGARGVGKTYGLMRYLIEQNEPFVYLRRLQTQIDICGSHAGNPFKKLNTDLGIYIYPEKHGKMLEFDVGEGESKKTIALGVSLSTVATIRGFDFSGYNYIVFDEFIPMVGEKPIKNEFNAFLNLYETINRNRELEGLSAVKAILLGNANQLVNPYFSGWQFTKTAVRMIRGKQMVYRTQDNSRMMILLLDSPISEKKRSTALYTNANDGFLSMALDNAFRTDETQIGSKPLKEYLHIVSVGEIGIYKHKVNGDWYISSVKQTPCFDDYGFGLKQFFSAYYYLRAFYIAQKNFTFETFELELLFREYLGINSY